MFSRGFPNLILRSPTLAKKIWEILTVGMMSGNFMVVSMLVFVSVMVYCVGIVVVVSSVAIMQMTGVGLWPRSTYTKCDH